jgi:hypothetical protein
MLFDEHKNLKDRFDLNSALKFFSVLKDYPEHELQKSVRMEFVKCQMTNLDDLLKSATYFHLKFEEFLMLLCRMSLLY